MNYPSRSQVKLKRTHKKESIEKQDLYERESYEEREKPYVDKVDVLKLPSRKDIHQTNRKEKEKKKSDGGAKKVRIQFPLVRILLLLFFIMVSSIFIYSIFFSS
ncbi:hypothetical protein QA612_09025 [Evansella sp. AB-P1]|uniref:hypothetical protein n=1 Tax=Evansella sp. AB-P1 TaxID=3037653 RepID=UPI00241E6DEA|nr:hypothetical protein [Evansella sp. AB-P1]MDG5787638.1 hypothetical protein [Evansella sp. AB-P1]